MIAADSFQLLIYNNSNYFVQYLYINNRTRKGLAHLCSTYLHGATNSLDSST